MTEKGSDERLAELGEPALVTLPLEADEAALEAEEERVCDQPADDDDGGLDYPDPDAAPPAEQSHDEFDPVPPEAA